MRAGPRSFFFIRHGETGWNREGRLQGQREASLNPLGLRQAVAAGASLAGLLRRRGLAARELDFVASPLSRTRDTMDRVRTGLDLPREPYRLDDRLKEMSFGAWEGRTWHELKRAEPDLLAARRRDVWHFVPPGGESYAMLLERVAPWLAELAADAVVVAHGGVARVLLHLAGGVEAERATGEEVHQGRVLAFADGAASWV